MNCAFAFCFYILHYASHKPVTDSGVFFAPGHSKAGLQIPTLGPKAQSHMPKTQKTMLFYPNISTLSPFLRFIARTRFLMKIIY